MHPGFHARDEKNTTLKAWCRRYWPKFCRLCEAGRQAGGATGPPVTANDSPAAPPGFSSSWPRPLCQEWWGQSCWSCSPPCADSPALCIPQVLESPAPSSFTREPRSIEGSPAPGRACLGFSSAKEVHLGRTWPLVPGRALGNTMHLAAREWWFAMDNICCGSRKLWALGDIKWPESVVLQQGTISLCGLHVAWSAVWPDLAFG